MRPGFILFLFLLSQTALSQVHQFTLKNGLTVLVKEDHRANVALSMVWYHVGAADELDAMTGVAHALEHFMFKGTPAHPLGVFSKTIAALGGQDNAFTTHDYTAYFEKLPANQLSNAFKLEADRMQHLLWDEHEFEQEMKVIREERRLRTDDNPQALALERYMASAYTSTPYHRPVIGWMNDLNQMTIADAKSWYQRFYAPNNATLVVVGDVDPQEVKQLAENYFGEIKKQTNYIRKKHQEADIRGKQAVELIAKAQLPMLIFGYPTPNLNNTTQAWEPYALELLASFLSNGESSHLTKTLIRKKEIASGVDVSYALYSRYPSQFIFFGIPTQGRSLDELKSAMQHEISSLKTNLIDAQTLERIKIQLIAQKTFEKDSIMAQAMELGIVASLGLSPSVLEEYNEHINQITAEQLRDVANRYFNDDRETESRLIPAHMKEPV